MQQPVELAEQARDWRLEQGPHLIELMDVITHAGKPIIAVDSERLWLVLDDLEQLIGCWRSVLRVAQSPVSIEGAMSATGARR